MNPRTHLAHSALLAALASLGHRKVVMLVGSEEARAVALKAIEGIEGHEVVVKLVEPGIDGRRPEAVIVDGHAGAPAAIRLRPRYAGTDPYAAEHYDQQRRRSKADRKRDPRWKR